MVHFANRSKQSIIGSCCLSKYFFVLTLVFACIVMCICICIFHSFPILLCICIWISVLVDSPGFCGLPSRGPAFSRSLLFPFIQPHLLHLKEIKELGKKYRLKYSINFFLSTWATYSVITKFDFCSRRARQQYDNSARKVKWIAQK